MRRTFGIDIETRIENINLQINIHKYSNVNYIFIAKEVYIIKIRIIEIYRKVLKVRKVQCIECKNSVI